jgi:hypothetical protein
VPIFETADGRLTALRQVRPGAELYETEIEDLLWGNLDAFYGTDLFPVARQPIIDTGGRPDVIALDETGRLVVFEVKRSIERTQLAQCLEYAGWARRTSLDTLCRIYHGGADRFFLDWQEFTGTGTPLTVEPSPVLVLVAQEFDDRTSDALGFLTDSGLPVYPVPVSAYEDGQQHRLYLIGSDYDDSGITEPAVPGSRRSPTAYTYKGRRLAVSDLIEAGFLRAGETIEYRRAREGRVFPANLTSDGRVQLEDGRIFDSLSRAACELANIAALPGWEVWTAPERGGRRLMDIRNDFLASLAEPVDPA